MALQLYTGHDDAGSGPSFGKPSNRSNAGPPVMPHIAEQSLFSPNEREMINQSFIPCVGLVPCHRGRRRR